MKKRQLVQTQIILIVAIIVLSTLTLAQQPQLTSPTTIKIAVSILPQKYLAEQLLSGYRFDIQVMIGPGRSPATYDPTPKEIAELQEAVKYYTIGVPFEKRLIKKLEALDRSKIIVNTYDGIALRPIVGHHHHDGTECSHEGETLDPHVWLDPVLVKDIAFKMLYPEGYRGFNPNSTKANDELCQKLDSLDAYIAEKLAPYKNEKLYVFHPSFGYFCDRYGLEQVAIETEGKEPSARQLAQLIKQAKEDKAKVIIIQSQFSTKTAEAIASEIGAEVISLDPLAYDYINNMKYMADTIAKALSK